MSQSIEVIFDGEVLRLQQPVDLQLNQRYRITIEPAPMTSEAEPMPRAFAEILARAEDLGVPDLAAQHDHYLYGTPKQ